MKSGENRQTDKYEQIAYIGDRGVFDVGYYNLTFQEEKIIDSVKIQESKESKLNVMNTYFQIDLDYPRALISKYVGLIQKGMI